MVCQKRYCRVTAKAPVKRQKEEKRREEGGRAARSLGKPSCPKATEMQQRGSKGKEREHVVYSEGAQAKGKERREEEGGLFVMTVDRVSSPALPGVALRLKVSVGRSGDGSDLNGDQIEATVSGREKGRRW